MFEAIFYALLFPVAMLYGLHRSLLKILADEDSIPIASLIFNIDKPPVSAETIKAMRGKLLKALSEYPENACRMIAISGLALAMLFMIDIALFSRTEQLLSSDGVAFVKKYQPELSFCLYVLSAITAFYGAAFGFLSEKIKNRIYKELNSLESADEHYQNSIEHIVKTLPSPYDSKFDTYSKTVGFYKRKLTVAEINIARKIINNHSQQKEEQNKCPPEIFIP